MFFAVAGPTAFYQPESTVIDMESQTTSASGNTSLIEEIVEMNRIKFPNRWGEGNTH